MTLRPGRILKAAELDGRVQPLEAKTEALEPRGRVMKSAVYAATLEAQARLEAAEAQARELVQRAERAAAELRLNAEITGRAEGIAAVAARRMALAELEARSDERQLERTISLATLLAERLLGHALALDPELIVAIARQALAEARGARQIQVFAHPEDAAILQRALEGLGFSSGVVRITVDAARERGSLRMVTDIGTLDAELAPQLERLAARLRQALTA